MTMPALAKPIGSRLPYPGERDAANQLRRVLASQATDERDQTLTVTSEVGETTQVILTPGLSKLLMELLRFIGKGDAVTLVPVGQMLTTQQAADILNVSRPFLISLIDKGEIPHVLTGRHRRIKAEDLFDYKRLRDERREAALCDLAELDADLI